MSSILCFYSPVCLRMVLIVCSSFIFFTFDCIVNCSCCNVLKYPPNYQTSIHVLYVRSVNILHKCSHHIHRLRIENTQLNNNQLSKNISESTTTCPTSSSPVGVRIVFRAPRINFALHHILLHLL